MDAVVIVSSVTALLGSVSAFILGLLAYRQKSKADGALAASKDTELAITGQAGLIGDLQREVRRLHEEVAELRRLLTAAEQREETYLSTIRELRAGIG